MSKDQKKPKKEKEPKSISIEDHKRELAAKDEAISQQRAEAQRIKDASLSTVKDYKERFDKQQAEIAELKAQIEQQKAESDAKLAEQHKRIEKLNETHGATVKKLRDQLAGAAS